MLGSRHHALEAMPDLPEPSAEAERQHDLNAVGPKDVPGPSRTEAGLAFVVFDFKAGRPPVQLQPSCGHATG